MAREEETMVQLATRIPKDIHRRLRLHCVTQELTMMEFVIRAIEERLARDKKRGAQAG
jgi:predicted HicB family RNase H-like nuclease